MPRMTSAEERGWRRDGGTEGRRDGGTGLSDGLYPSLSIKSFMREREFEEGTRGENRAGERGKRGRAGRRGYPW